MARIKIQLSDVLKKHLKIVVYLVLSAGIAYGASVLADKPELVYATPVVNYILFAIKQELDKEGYIQALKN